jgi:ribonucleoside-diphosphate reductase alpha chain
LSAFDSCRLISINLKHFVKNEFTNESNFDFNHFGDVVRKAMRLSDDLVELEIEKLEKIINASDTQDEKDLWSNLLKACKNGRRTGLGTHGLADAIARLQLRYDDDKAIDVIDEIYKTLRNESYRESVNLAQERGQFSVFSWEKEKENSFIKSLSEDTQCLISKYGRRNISILTNAPTGSVSIMSQTSSGLEPVFRNWYTRRRKLSHNEQELKPDFIDKLGDKWLEYKIFHHNLVEWMEMNGIAHDDEYQVPEFFITSDQIDWKKRVTIQSIIQKYIDHSISSTINLPKNTKPAIIGELYFQGWKKGLKGITVYVDGSRTGVLVTNKGAFPQQDASKRPRQLTCDIHHTTIHGQKWTILIGLLDKKPYEVIGGLAEYVEIPKKYNEGTLTKHTFKTRDNRYDLSFGDDGNEIIIKDVVKVFDNPNHSAFTRMISLGLRHGAKINYIVEQLQKTKDADMFSFARCVGRVLKNYIVDGTKANGTKHCPECELKNLIYVEGCVTCQDCGWAKCG